MITRVFTLRDQCVFAELSGDFNPLHVDPVVARRLLFGSVVVHTIHSLLWGLDVWLQDKTEKIELVVIKAEFRKPIRLEETVRYSIKNESSGNVVIELLVNEQTAVIIKFSWFHSTGVEAGGVFEGSPERDVCKILLVGISEKKFGTLPLFLNHKKSNLLFERVTQLFPSLQIAQLLASTRLVSMECPGMHSVFSAIALDFGQDGEKNAPSLTYEITELDIRHSLVVMKVTSPKMTGHVTAFLRPPIQEQISYRCFVDLVQSAEFADQQALVIGGSRGLGEVCAKILAAGGATVKITFNQGEGDSRRIVHEINSNGGSADCAFFDILDSQMGMGEKFGREWRPSHLYYFATPFIASGAKGGFSASLFQKFCNYYVIGFQRIVEEFYPLGLKGAFYPSSVFVNEIPANMGEYAAAKVAGEVLCAFLEKTKKGLTIMKPRLPMMSTDQTVSFMYKNTSEPGAVILQHLRSLRDSSGATFGK